jgi:beta-lactam-binding protein with PASTA domain
MPLISDSIGRVLGKRYRLLSALGTGASAHVFLAEDVSLQRHVAVKVLQPALASDEAFLKRFGAEARSVASLNHPHVLRVFDWGEDTDGPYLVLEYLGGGSLRDLLDRGVRLSHSQAANLGTEVAQGLAYAHARGLVHRDIKPANLLFDEEGRVRVADFGVARALAEAAWTEPVGSMVGTARYISPEAAEGKQVDGRADVYSLALVLYEAVSGEVPFVAETTLGTVMARVGSPLPPHASLGPLDDVLARAAAPDPGSRLDAAGLAARLGALASSLPTPEPLPLVPPNHPAVSPLVGFRAPAVSELTEVGTPTPKAPVGTKAGPGELFDAEPGGRDGATIVGVLGDGPAISTVRPNRKKQIGVVVACALAAILIAAAALIFGTNTFTPSHPTPNFVQQTLGQAQALAAKDHFTLHIEPGVKSISLGTGVVVSQTPAPGKVLKQGSTINVVPSIGKPNVSVPSLTGMNCTQAAAALTAVHLVAHCVPPVYNDNVANTIIISWMQGNVQEPTKAPYGSTITITPSEGHSLVAVPDIPGTYTFGEAQAALQVANFTAVEANASSSTVPAGNVISTSPASGTMAPYQSQVTVTISSGPPTVQVPNVFDDTVSQADAALTSAGLVVSGVSGNPNKSVTGTSPGQGTTVEVGSPVQITTR